MKHAYSDNLCNKTIAVLSIVPPPFGGVSVHTQRLIAKLKKQHNKIYFFCTEKRFRTIGLPFYLSYLFCWLFIKRPEIVMYQTMYLNTSIAEIGLLAALRKIFRYELFLVDHDCKHQEKRTRVGQLVLRKVVRNNKLIAIGSTTAQAYKKIGINLTHASIESSFIPPDVSQESILFSQYPELLKQFIFSKKPLIVANAFRIGLVGTVDLYGIDLCISAMMQLQKDFPSVGLVIVTSKIDESYWNLLCKENVHIYLLQGNYALWPLFRYADLFVRPTRWDSYGISIAEALHFGVPAVASDVCERAQGTMLFRSNDLDDFIDKIITVLREKNNELNLRTHNLHEKQT